MGVFEQKIAGKRAFLELFSAQNSFFSSYFPAKYSPVPVVTGHQVSPAPTHNTEDNSRCCEHVELLLHTGAVLLLLLRLPGPQSPQQQQHWEEEVCKMKDRMTVHRKMTRSLSLGTLCNPRQ